MGPSLLKSIICNRPKLAPSWCLFLGACLWLNLTSGMAEGQVCKTIRLTTIPSRLDTSLIAPGSVRVTGLADSLWILDLQAGTIRLKELPIGLAQDYLICYRTIQLDLRRPVMLRSNKDRDSTRYYLDVSTRPVALADKRVELFSTPSFQKSGSLSRGLSLGNNQSIFVNSALNLQLQGQLSDQISLTALINDQQLPFQPQGNTAQIRELDRVLIQLDHKNAQLQAGDVILQNRPSQFLRYFKNVQGARLTTRFGPDTLHQAITTVAGAIAKGRFASIIIPSIEGVQGPYRLRSPNNEVFIVIQANSERVYLDNQLRQRGYNRDYVIDYNTGEITFTAQVLITRFTRIRVDYEYAERNYSRSIIEGNHYQTWGRWSGHANFYQEQDDANKPISYSLDDRTRANLAAIGDTISKAIVSGASLVTDYSQDQVLYAKRDTIGPDQRRDSIFVYSTTKQDKLYSVIFQDVGEGRGSYILVNTLANGRVYRWAGRGLGKYLPQRQLVTPNRKNMFVIGGEFRLRQGQTIGAEVAFSQVNNNLFAGNSINRNGNAQRLYYRHENLPIGGRHSKLVGSDTTRPQLSRVDWLWSASANYERLDKQFTAIDRFRYIEFDRDWSASGGDTLAAEDHLLIGNLGIQRGETMQLKSGLKRRVKDQNVDGWQGDISLRLPLGPFRLSADHFWLQNRRPQTTSTWQRLSTDLSLPRQWGTLGGKYNLDHNQIKTSGNDSTIGSAMYFEELAGYVRSSDSLRTRLGFEGALRTDYQPFEGLMRANTQARTASLITSHRSKANNSVAATVTYRVLQSLIPTDSTPGKSPAGANEETIQGRIDWSGEYFSRHIRTELTIATGVGRELQREFRYVRVANPTDGTHQWIDFNDDGQQQLDEFVDAARPEDRLFIKVFVPTTNFTNAYATNLNYKLTFQLPRKWANKSFVPKQLSKISGNLGWTLDRKLLNSDLSTRFNPWLTPSDDNLLANIQTIRSNLYFNRTSPEYGADLAYTNSRRRSLLTAGFESLATDELKLGLRTRLGQLFNLQTTGSQQQRITQSNFLTNRNYSLIAYEATPELSYQPDGRFRITGSYALSSRRNQTSNEVAAVSKYGLESRLAQVGKRSVSLMLKLIQIHFDGDASNPATYDLLEGLLPGQNLTWGINWQQTLFNGLQLNLTYDGRKSQDQAIIHLGRAQVTALF